MTTLPDEPTPSMAWYRSLIPRMAFLWPAKMMGTVVGLIVFFGIYFFLLRHPLRPCTVVPLTPVDRWLAFRPQALPVYLSLWFYLSLAPALVNDRRELLSYGLAAVALSSIGLSLFLVFPTAVPPSDVDWSQHPSFSFLKAADASGNACPSLHVAFAVFTAIAFERLWRQMGAGRLIRGLNWIWCLGIAYSTMAIRQHVFLDVLAGAALGAVVAGAHHRIVCAQPRKPRVGGLV